MGVWVNPENGRMILKMVGDQVLVMDPDLPWYDGDVNCTAYRAEFDEGARTLYLHGLTSWLIGPDELDDAESAERRLELDASSLHQALTAADFKNGVITKLYYNSEDYPYTRP